MLEQEHTRLQTELLEHEQRLDTLEARAAAASLARTRSPAMYPPAIRPCTHPCPRNSAMAPTHSLPLTPRRAPVRQANLQAELRVCSEMLEAEQRTLRQLRHHEAELLRNAQTSPRLLT